MAKSESQDQFTSKLQALRERLLGDLSTDELQRMQLQTDMLERASLATLDYHHHDTSEHHDHVTPSVFEEIEERELDGLVKKFEEIVKKRK
jgi:hypothetical protein